MDINRKTAYHILMDVETKNSYSNIAINHNIIAEKPTSPAFVRELVYGVLRNKILLDYIIDKFVKKGIKSIKSADLTLLRMGIYQIGYMNSVPEYAAVNESVVMAKRFCRGRDGFINAVLRSYLKQKDNIELPAREEDEIKYLSVKYSYEPWIINTWLQEYDKEFVEQILEASNLTPPLTIRVNLMKTSKEELKTKLETLGFEIQEGKICEAALYIKGSGLLETQEYQKGLFSVQDEASMLVSYMLEPKKGDTIIDVCSAPGGKTLSTAEKMGNVGTIIAMDIYERKLKIIENEATRLGIKIITTKEWDAAKANETLINTADRVIVDAPCSGLGVIRKKPEVKYKPENTEMEFLPEKQVAILKASSQYVKSGGTLIYSTCTINKAENYDVITEFLRTNSDFKKIEEIQLLPNINGTDGFFICKMQKEEI